MANPVNPFGFRPIIRLGGSVFSVQTYGKPASDNTAIFCFDLVGHITGVPVIPLPENPTYNLSRVRSGQYLTPGTSLWLGSSITYGAASVASVHPVADEVDAVFIAMVSGALSVSTAAHAGLNGNVIATFPGSVLTKQSGMMLDGTTVAATSTLDLKINRIAMISPNVEGANAIVEVFINKHALGQATLAT